MRSRSAKQAISQKDLPKGFLLRIMAKTIEMQQEDFGGAEHACAYHTHWDDEEMIKCPAHVSYAAGAGFRNFTEAFIKMLVKMRCKVANGVAEAAFSTLQIATDTAPNGAIRVECNNRREVRLISSAGALLRANPFPVTAYGQACYRATHSSPTTW
jgi:hypothetical protein